MIISTADDMRVLGECIGKKAQTGMIIILDGPLGAGKTTLTQGIAQGLGINQRIQSPTFTIMRFYDNDTSAPDLLHVDAYRLATEEEIDDLDLDYFLERSIGVMEWGRGKVEHLSSDIVYVEISRSQIFSPIDGGMSVDEVNNEERHVCFSADSPHMKQWCEDVEKMWKEKNTDA
ncbi:MAG: tRNA (adenosine(37)-N6)-threonylcarbamoyltransferase complex ATPase subunit type 1 TsaE [Actinomycetaceae bacterium]|nr:tRNA (adenosine(37)-N6)-threonylcarbamoyltransferase complex ATPase subunit type 1 TsaE [Actinomycetaceae bacterium]